MFAQENKTSDQVHGNGSKKATRKEHDPIAFEEFASQFKIKPYPEPKGPLAPNVVLGGSLPDTKPAIQKKAVEEEKLLQGKGDIQLAAKEEEEEKPLQGKGDIQLASDENKEIQAKPENTNNTGMPNEVKGKMESAFNTDFSDVKIHTNSAQSEQLGALAYTQGSDVHFASNQYNPDTQNGQELLGHELTHVVQQRHGRVKPTKQGKGMAINDSPALENEADVTGKQAAQGLLKEPELVKNASGSRELRASSSSPLKVGDNVTYSLVQSGSELWKSGSKITYHWVIDNTLGTTFLNKITPETTLECIAENPGNYKISVQVLEDDVPVNHMKYELTQNVFMEKKNTELGGLSVGNFDFKFDGSSANISTRVKFNFDPAIPSASETTFKTDFFNAINSIWGASGRIIECTTNTGQKFNFPIIISCVETTGTDYHKLVHVHKDVIREKVILDINLNISSDKTTIAHEFGHVLGLYDEYDGGLFENIMFWHDDGSQQSDTNALMNSGSGLRDRYFSHYMNAVKSTAPSSYTFRIK